VGGDPDANAARRAAILEAATRVFLRYGFKKTSMDDLARAAGLSRQGLYLHFVTKEALFEEAVLSLVAALRSAFREALAGEERDIEERLLDAFEAVHGHAIGQMGAEQQAELLAAAAELVTGVVSEFEEGIMADAARVLIRSGAAAGWKRVGISATALAENLHSTSSGIKHRVSTQAEYREQMRVAVRIICRGAGNSS
jgi:AcrR family transcriptional regulator